MGALGKEAVVDDVLRAQQHVAAAAADQRIGRHVADDIIPGRACAAGDVLEVGNDIAGRIAAAHRIGGEIGDQARARGGIIQRVGTAAAVERIGSGAARNGVVAGAARDGVVAAAAGDHVGAGVAGEDVIVGRAGDVFEVGQDIAGGVAAALRAGVGQVDGHARRRGRVIDGVGSGAAVKRVGAGAARNRVIAGAAGDDVGVGIAGEDVVCRPSR